MLAEINDVLEIITVVIGIFLLEDYVFLEPEMDYLGKPMDMEELYGKVRKWIM